MATIILPIPIQTPPKDCVVVDGNKYCREINSSAHQIGAAILIVLLFFAYIAVLIWLSDEKDNYWILCLGICIPLFITGVILFIK